MVSHTKPQANQVSISPIFYEQLFCTKVFCAAFIRLQFGFVIFWQKDFGAKAAHIMLVKLTPWNPLFQVSDNLMSSTLGSGASPQIHLHITRDSQEDQVSGPLNLFSSYRQSGKSKLECLSLFRLIKNFRYEQESTLRVGY